MLPAVPSITPAGVEQRQRRSARPSSRLLRARNQASLSAPRATQATSDPQASPRSRPGSARRQVAAAARRRRPLKRRSRRRRRRSPRAAGGVAARARCCAAVGAHGVGGAERRGHGFHRQASQGAGPAEFVRRRRLVDAFPLLPAHRASSALGPPPSRSPVLGGAGAPVHPSLPLRRAVQVRVPRAWCPAVHAAAPPPPLVQACPPRHRRFHRHPRSSQRLLPGAVAGPHGRRAPVWRRDLHRDRVHGRQPGRRLCVPGLAGPRRRPGAARLLWNHQPARPGDAAARAGRGGGAGRGAAAAAAQGRCE